MARELRISTVLGMGMTDAQGQAVATGTYGEMMLSILKAGGPRGSSPDELLQAVAAIIPLQAAVDAHADTVRLSDEHWQTLRRKMEETRFMIVSTEIADFVRHVREAVEIGAVPIKAA